MAKYRINSRGASHTRKENGEFRRYGKNDIIELKTESVEAGLYDHLKLTKVSGDVATTSSPANEVSSSIPVLSFEEQKALNQKKGAEDEEIAKRALANTLLNKAEEASSAKEVKEIGEQAKEAGIVAEVPAKKAELIEALAEFTQDNEQK